MGVKLASLVAYRVLHYPMGALIAPETLLIVSPDEGEGEGRDGVKSGAARQGREGRTTSAEPGNQVSSQLHLKLHTLLLSTQHVFVLLML